VSTNPYLDFNQALIADFRANQGQVSDGPFKGRNLLLLTTVGARTGAERISPLAYTRKGDAYVVIGSKGGSDDHPAWVHNLFANPVVTIEVGPERVRVRARQAEGEERDSLYAAQAALMPGFAEYERRTARKIPVFVLEPIPDQN
jgi:deazaflavin-dependent oxidoreductase (nitroreductase family)